MDSLLQGVVGALLQVIFGVGAIVAFLYLVYVAFRALVKRKLPSLKHSAIAITLPFLCSFTAYGVFAYRAGFDFENIDPQQLEEMVQQAQTALDQVSPETKKLVKELHDKTR